MSVYRLETGFEEWSTEVAALDRPIKDDPYIPTIALVGVYSALAKDVSELTAFSWRRSVFASAAARTGLYMSLGSFFNNQIGDGAQRSVAELRPAARVSSQHRHEYAAILDGLPDNVMTIASREQSLAQWLGHAHYERRVVLQPLGLSECGTATLATHYPQTAKFLEAME